MRSGQKSTTSLESPMRAALSASALALLAACGGGGEAQQGSAHAFAAGLAAAAAPTPAQQERRTALTATQQGLEVLQPVEEAAWFSWLERSFPQEFEAGPQTEALAHQGVQYRVRYYPQLATHVGLTADGRVFVAAPFTGGQIRRYGELPLYACEVNPLACTAEAQQLRRPFWTWAGTRQCDEVPPSAAVARVVASLQAQGLEPSNARSAWVQGLMFPAVCGAEDGRLVVVDLPLASLRQALALGLVPYTEGVSGVLDEAPIDVPGLPGN